MFSGLITTLLAGLGTLATSLIPLAVKIITAHYNNKIDKTAADKAARTAFLAWVQAWSTSKNTSATAMEDADRQNTELDNLDKPKAP